MPQRDLRHRALERACGRRALLAGNPGTCPGPLSSGPFSDRPRGSAVTRMHAACRLPLGLRVSAPELLPQRRRTARREESRRREEHAPLRLPLRLAEAGPRSTQRWPSRPASTVPVPGPPRSSPQPVPTAPGQAFGEGNLWSIAFHPHFCSTDGTLVLNLSMLVLVLNKTGV